MFRLLSILLSASTVSILIAAPDSKTVTDNQDNKAVSEDVPSGSSDNNPTSFVDTDRVGSPDARELDHMLDQETGSTFSDRLRANQLQRSSYTGAEGYFEYPADNVEALTRKIFDEMPYLQEDSLAQAMADAYKTHPQIKEQVTALRVSVERTVQAKAGWRPTINATLSVGASKARNSGDSVDQPFGGSSPKTQRDDSASARVELRQNLFAGGQTLNQMREAESSYKAAKSSLADVEQNVLLQVSSSYMALMSKYAEIELLKRNETNLRETLKATQDKYDVGEETRTSVAQAEAQLADGIAQRITAESELEALKATFERATFRQPGKLARPPLPRNMPKSLAEVVEQARKNAPTLLRAMQEEKTARYTVDRITGALLPSVDLVGSSTASKDKVHTRYLNPNPAIINPSKNRHVNNSVQLQMTIPLYEAGSTRSQRREAAESAEQARIRIEQVRREIVERAVATWNRFKSAESKIEEFKRQVRANLVSLDGTQQELLVGSKILLDVLNAIRLLVESQVNLVRAEYDYLSAAYELMFVTGQLTAKSLGLKVDLYDPDIHYRETTNSF